MGAGDGFGAGRGGFGAAADGGVGGVGCIGGGGAAVGTGRDTNADHSSCAFLLGGFTAAVTTSPFTMIRPAAARTASAESVTDCGSRAAAAI